MIMASAFAALAFVSCNKEEAKTTQELTYKFTIGEKPGYGVDSRAVKTGWEEGDKIYIVFDDNTPVALSDFMIIQYQSGNWNVVQQPAHAPSASGTLDALFYNGPTTNMNFPSGKAEFRDAVNLPLILTENRSYTVSGNVVSGTIDMYVPGESVQICVTGLPDSEWKIAFDADFLDKYAFLYRGDSFGIYSRNRDYNTFATLSNVGGAYYLHPLVIGSGVFGIARDYHFRLYSSGYGAWKKSFAGKTINEKDAIKFSGPSGITGSEAAGTVVNGWTKE